MADANNSIKDWSITTDSNYPQGNQVIGVTLDDQLRAIKAIIRQESLNKQWERWDITCLYVGTLSVKLRQPANNQPWGPEGNGPAYIGRKVKITHTDSSHPAFFGAIRTVTGNVASSGVYYTVVELSPEYNQTVYNDIAEIQFGAVTPNSNTLPTTVRSTQKNPFFSNTLTLLPASTTTRWKWDATFPDLPPNHPIAGEVYYVQFDWSNLSGFGTSTSNAGQMELSINGSNTIPAGGIYEIYRHTFTAYGVVPAPGVVALRAGDVMLKQTVALTFDTSVTPYRWQMISPSAGAATFFEIADLFSVADSQLVSSVNKDITNCVWQGYITVFKNYVIQWALVRQIPVTVGTTIGNRLITLPKDSGVSEILAILATPVDLNSNQSIVVNRVSSTQIQVFNYNTATQIPCYVLVIARLS